MELPKTQSCSKNKSPTHLPRTMGSASSSKIHGIQSLYFGGDGSLQVGEERIFIRHQNPKEAPRILYMRNDDRRLESSIEVMSQLPFPNPVEMVGQSSGLACFRDSISPTFYVWNVTTERVEAKIDEAGGEPRPGFSGEAVYGFGHTKTGSFKIVRVPYPIIEFRKEEQQRKDHRRTSLDIYDSNMGKWEQLEYPDQLVCQPCPEHSCFVPKHGFLFWKVTVNGNARILGVNVNGGPLQIIKPPVVDGFVNFKIGTGSDSQIIGCNFDLLSPALKIWNMMRCVDQEWTWDFVSTIPISPDPDTSRFFPLLNFTIGDEEYYLFLRNEDTIVGFISADRELWHSKVFFSKWDATPIDFSRLGFQFIQGSSLGFESLHVSAVSVGARRFKLEEDYTNNDEGSQEAAPGTPDHKYREELFLGVLLFLLRNGNFIKIKLMFLGKYLDVV